MTTFIDFETRSACDLRRHGAHVYAADPTTDAWCAAYAVDDGPIELWRPGEPSPVGLRDGPFCAHNAAFEQAVWAGVMTPRHGWPACPGPDAWLCTAARAAAMALPRGLDEVCAALGLAVRKAKAGHQEMLRLARPRRLLADGSPVWWDEPERLERLYAYCRRDVEAERALLGRLRALPPFERAVELLDARINVRGLALDLELIERALALIATSKSRINGELAAVTGGEVDAFTRRDALVCWLRAQGVDVETIDKAAVKGLLDGDDLPDPARRALELRREGAKSSTAKLTAMRRRACADGRARGLFMYHGAATGRWTGRGVQPQNFPRPELDEAAIDAAVDLIRGGADAESVELCFGPVLKAVSDCLRACVVAAPGHELLGGDFSAVEARGVAWLADARGLLDAFRTGRDPYIEMSARIYGRPTEAIGKDSRERFVGKTSVLAAGYGCGPRKFREMCASMAGTTVSADEAELAIATYRGTHAEVPRLWRELEWAAAGAVAAPGTMHTAAEGRLWFISEGDFLRLVLPSGRSLFYPEPRLEPVETPWGELREAVTYAGVDKYTHKWSRQKTYGGRWTENAVSAICRDLLAAAMLRLEAKGYPVVLHVHDEVVCEVPAGFGSPDEFELLMGRVPRWAPGFPLKSSVWLGGRYRK